MEQISRTKNKTGRKGRQGRKGRKKGRKEGDEKRGKGQGGRGKGERRREKILMHPRSSEKFLSGRKEQELLYVLRKREMI